MPKDGEEETLRYVDEAYHDVYSRTKAAAEKLVLAADGTKARATSVPSGVSGEGRGGGGGGDALDPLSKLDPAGTFQMVGNVGIMTAMMPTLRTCAVRPCGIYGPGEARHLPRFLRSVSQL